MLTAIRERASGWIAWVIVALISIPFTLWGINYYFEGNQESAVANVNGEPISLYSYQQNLSRQQQLLMQQMGDQFDPQLMETLNLNRAVLDSLINNQLLSQFTTDNNFQISDEQLRKLIENLPAFQTDEKFDVSRYQTILASNGFTPQSFESSQRMDEAVNQLRTGIIDTAFATRFEKNQVVALQEQDREISYMQIPTDKFSEESTVSDEDIARHYERNSESYQSEARVKVDYIELSIDSLNEFVSPTEEDLLGHYEENKGRFRTAESRTASHILIAAGESLEESEREQKLELAQSVLAKADAGEDFSELAEQYSEDPGSKSRGGDLGLIAPGQMVKPFEDAVFSMAPDEIAGPIETRFGYHIIKLTGLTEEEQQTFDEVRTEVESEVRKLQAENLFTELAESFKNLVFEDPDDIASTADELGLPIQASDWFTKNSGEGIAQNPQVRRAAFSPDVLDDNLVSEAVEIGFDKFVAVQKVSHEPVAQIPLDDIKERIREEIRQQRSAEKVLEFGAQMLGRLEADGSTREAMEKLAEENELEVKEFKGKKQDIPAPLNALGNAVFSLAMPTGGSVLPGGIALDDGSYVLYLLESIKLAEVSSAGEEVIANLENRILSRDGTLSYNQFQAVLRSEAEIDIFEDQMQRGDVQY